MPPLPPYKCSLETAPFRENVFLVDRYSKVFENRELKRVEQNPPAHPKQLLIILVSDQIS